MPKKELSFRHLEKAEIILNYLVKSGYEVRDAVSGKMSARMHVRFRVAEKLDELEQKDKKD